MAPLLQPKEYRDSTVPENFQKDENYDNEKQSEQSGVIKPSSYTKNQKIDFQQP